MPKKTKESKGKVRKANGGSLSDLRRYLNESDAVVLGIIVSDLHLRHKPAKARSDDKPWYRAMLRALNEVRHVRDEVGGEVFYPGDIFHSPEEPVELVNFAIDNLLPGYGIPGQHDLPFHNYGDLHKTPYYTLVKAGIIRDLEAGAPCCFRKLDRSGRRYFVTGFPWQSTLKNNEDKDNFHFAMAHRYVWLGQHSFRGAPQTEHIKSMKDFLATYDAVAFGDNHKGFSWRNAFNCGSLMRHNTDQMDYIPQIGILLSDGHIFPYKMSYIEKDKWTVVQDVTQSGDVVSMDQLIKKFKELSDEIVQFDTMLESSIKNSNLTTSQQRILLSEIEKIRSSQK